MRIFLAEDCSVTGSLMADGLGGLGHVVEWAVNGRCIIKKLPFLVYDPDVLILDYLLEDGDALSVLRSLKEIHPGIAAIPVVIWTGQPRDRVLTITDDEIAAYVQKPTMPPAMDAIIRDVVGRRRKPDSWAAKTQIVRGSA